MRKLILTTALMTLGLPAVADDAALLIGVERYRELPRLSGGTDVIRADDDLRDAGYQVTTLTNGATTDTVRVLEEFAAQAAEAERLVVGLSGRFVTDGPRTWLLTANSPQPSLFGMGDNAVSLDSVMAVLSRTPGQAVLVLGVDIGEVAPHGSYLREGLGDLDIPQGVTVIYGGPNRVDDLLSDAIARPGVDVMDYARDNRRLWALGYTPRDLILQHDDSAPVVVVDPTLSIWETAQQVDTADSYRDFLFAYPRSPYAAEARRRLDALENDPGRIDKMAEDAQNLSRGERRAIQENLTLLGYNTRGVDGIFGRGTRSAIGNWQKDNRFDETGYLPPEQISLINEQAVRRAADIAAEEEAARAEQERLDRAYWENTGALGNEDGYRAYLDRFPEGIFAQEARDALALTRGMELAIAEEEALNLNPILARLIESRLDQMGFNPGRVDGRFDSDTRAAIARYQTQRNLPATGYVNQPTLTRLLADALGR